LRNVILVWVIGLTLGVGAGAATALLLMPSSEGKVPNGSSLADRLRLGQ
jgi:gas vesicle protein